MLCRPTQGWQPNGIGWSRALEDEEFQHQRLFGGPRLRRVPPEAFIDRQEHRDCVALARRRDRDGIPLDSRSPSGRAGLWFWPSVQDVARADSVQEAPSTRSPKCFQSFQCRLHYGWLAVLIDHLQKKRTGQLAVCVVRGRPQVPDDAQAPELLLGHS